MNKQKGRVCGACGTARPTRLGFGLRPYQHTARVQSLTCPRGILSILISLTMTEVWFYHLQRQPLERALPALIEKSLAKGWRVTVQARSEERLDALDAWLWTYSDESFLAH